MRTLKPELGSGQLSSRRLAVAGAYHEGEDRGYASTSASPHMGIGGGESPHPCLTDNNSMQIDEEGLRTLEIIKKEDREKYYEKVLPLLSGYQKKATARLQNCIEQAVKEYGSKALGVLHLTFAEDVPYQQAQDRINSLRTNIFADRYSVTASSGRKLNNYITICERGEKNGRLHFHVLFIKQGADFKTGSYWTFNKKKNRKEFHPNGDCRREWEVYRAKLKDYGFGDFVRIEPLQSVEGGAKYFSKYVGKGHYTRDESMKGKQLIRYGSGFSKYQSMKFSWVGGIARSRRGIIGEIGRQFGLEDDLPALNSILGSRWQHWAKDQILVACCFAGERLGKKSREFVEVYSQNRWGIEIMWGVGKGSFEHIPVAGSDPFSLYTQNDLRDLAMRELMERIDEIQFNQYEPNMIH